jgi:putative hemolysin
MSDKTKYSLQACGEFLVCIVLLSSIDSVSALRNPAAVYCNALNYEYMIKETSKGQIGVCMPAPSVECGEWDFLRGKCGIEHSFCVKSGYSQKAAKGLECGGGDPFAECLMCVLPAGGMIEVTELMGLNFEDDAGGAVFPDSVPATTLTSVSTLPHEVTGPDDEQGNDSRESSIGEQDAPFNYLYHALFILVVAVLAFFAYRRLRR